MRDIQVRLVRPDEFVRFNTLLAYHHPRGRSPDIGTVVRHVATPRHQPEHWLALPNWGSAALEYAARDRWLGWSRLQQRVRRPYLINNHRFCILPNSHIPHLGSHVLARSTQRIADDWFATIGLRPLLAETFVSAEVSTGTVYRAAGWMPIGLTAGYARTHGGRHHHGDRKLALVLPLADHACEQLARPLEPGSIRRWTLAPTDVLALASMLKAVTDTRHPRGCRYRNHAGLWAALAAIAASGDDPPRAYPQWLPSMPRAMWCSVGCRHDLRKRLPVFPSLATRQRAWAAYQATRAPTIVADWLMSMQPTGWGAA